MSLQEQEKDAKIHAPDGGYVCFTGLKCSWQFVKVVQSPDQAMIWFDSLGLYPARVWKVDKDGKTNLYSSK